MLRKQSENLDLVNSLLNQNGKVNYRKERLEREPEMKQAKKIEKDRSWAVEKGTERSEYNNPISRGDSSIRPARCASQGGITDMGGPSKHVNVSGKNSIWDSEVLANLSKTSSSKEMTKQEKDSTEKIRQSKQNEYKQSMSPKMGDDSENLVKKASTVSPVSAVSSGKGWIPANKLSMFDTNDNFDRLTSLRERVNPTVEKQVKIAETKTVSKSFSSKDSSNRFIDGIMSQSQDSSYKSVHNDSVERLYKVLAERNINKDK